MLGTEILSPDLQVGYYILATLIVRVRGVLLFVTLGLGASFQVLRLPSHDRERKRISGFLDPTNNISFPLAKRVW